MTDFLPVILNQPLDRQRYSREFKRQIVEASLVSGASIAGVALSYGINANLIKADYPLRTIYLTAKRKSRGLAPELDSVQWLGLPL